VRLVLRVTPPLLFGIFFLGIWDASIDSTRSTDPYLVKYKAQPAAELRVVLRNFDKGILVRNHMSGRVEFHKWDDVVWIEKQLDGAGPSIVSRFWEYCPKPKPPIP
jgi:hypothetical protein